MTDWSDLILNEKYINRVYVLLADFRLALKLELLFIQVMFKMTELLS